MSSGGAQIDLPDDLLREIDELVGAGARSQFLTDIVRREVHRLRLLRFLETNPAGWDMQDHPELRDGAAEWVESIRKDNANADAETPRN